jgi:hypothetical protein
MDTDVFWGATFAFAGALLVQAFHWQKVLRAQGRRKRRILTGQNVLIDLIIVACSTLLGLLGIKLAGPPVSYLIAAMIGIAPFETIKWLWKRFAVKTSGQKKGLPLSSPLLAGQHTPTPFPRPASPATCSPRMSAAPPPLEPATFFEFLHPD